jgi:hypothetical protein
MLYEKRHHALASRSVFFRRLGNSMLIASVFLGFSLGLGILGYRFFCHLGWIDSLLNASMILGGMGPVDPIGNNAGKIFASLYAIYSGVAFLGAFAIIIAPVLHRFMHWFHLNDK